MEEKKIISISFGSFIKLCIAIAFSLGILGGVLILVISLLGGEAHLTFGTIQLTGPSAGLASFFAMPIVASIGSFFYSIVAYLPFKLFLKYLGGLKLIIKVE